MENRYNGPQRARGYKENALAVTYRHGQLDIGFMGTSKYTTYAHAGSGNLRSGQ